ncbi:adenylosuccinate lyase, partial [bacterium]|nr:adenylosuccinate lyase [bacterium]
MIERYTRPRMGEIWTREYRFKKMLDVEILACEAQSLLGIIPGQAVKAIKERAKFDVSRIDEIEAEVHHDVIAFLTSVAENVGEESRYIHLGLTSSDVLDTALSAQMREAGQLIEKDVQELLGVLREKAKEHKETVMVGRTHGIHAEPMTFGLKLCLWYSEMKRNLDRLGRAVENISYGKLSGAVGTFAHLDPFVEEY